MSEKPIIENRRLDEGHPFYAVKSQTLQVGASQLITLSMPTKSLVKLQGLLLTADTSQTILAVYADIEDDAHLMLPAQAAGGDIDYSMVASAGKNCEDIFGNVFLRKALLIRVTQATSAQTFKAEIYGARYPVIK